jgi:hypothetical protein
MIILPRQARDRHSFAKAKLTKRDGCVLFLQAGMLFLLQKLDFHDTILDYYMLYNQYEKVIAFANEFGKPN